MHRVQIRRIGRYLARRAVGYRGNCPVKIIDGNQPPKVFGDLSGYETLAGEPIRYPRAYQKIGWSNMRYVPSTRRIEVGHLWLARAVQAWRLSR